MQAKDLDADSLMLDIYILQHEPLERSLLFDLPRSTNHWVMIWDLKKRFPDVPEKVFQAKLRNLIKKGLIDGCVCGCRGDFYVRNKGLLQIEDRIRLLGGTDEDLICPWDWE